jgi:hypothetical protein
MLPPPQAIQPVISMPVRRLKFEIWDEGLLVEDWEIQLQLPEKYIKQHVDVSSEGDTALRDH